MADLRGFTPSPRALFRLSWRGCPPSGLIHGHVKKSAAPARIPVMNENQDHEVKTCSCRFAIGCSPPRDREHVEAWKQKEGR